MFLHWSFLFLLLLYSIDISLSADNHWNYADEGPAVWPDLYSVCDGNSQSPINIKTACTTYQQFEPFNFSSAYDSIQNFTIINDGHTLAGTQVDKTLFPLILTGGGLPGTFEFVNFHLHWGENYKSGSEHQINGESFAGEIHLVHLNPEIGRYAVLGLFIMSTGPEGSRVARSASQSKTRRRQIERETVNTENATLTAWENYVEIASNLNETNDTVVISLKLSSLIGTHLSNFYRYNGSLTIPPCNESVIWTVFQTPIEFTETELHEMRAKLFHLNYRPTQPLKSRAVFRSFPNDTTSSISDYACCGQNGIEDGKSDGSSIFISNKHFFPLFLYIISHLFGFIFIIIEC